MPDELVDAMAFCASCGEPIRHSPIRMPVGSPIANPEKPAHYAIEYVNMCTRCVREQLDTLEEKVRRGEMSPANVWSVDDDGNPSIITTTTPEPTQRRAKAGYLRRVVGWLWNKIY